MNTLETINKFGAVVLAAGKGTRLGCEEKPKVMMEIGGKPLVSYIVDTLYKVGLKSDQICLVVGFQQNRVIDYFGGRVIYAYQEEQLGTAHAAYTGMKVLPDGLKEILVLNGDDGAFYKPATIANLLNKHTIEGTMASLLVTNIDPTSFSYGRIVRGDNVIEIIEKEYLTDENKDTTETSTGTFCFNREWYRHMFPNMPIMDKLGEYGLPTAFMMAQKEGLAVQAVKLLDNREWFGVNTLEELAEADKRKRMFL